MGEAAPCPEQPRRRGSRRWVEGDEGRADRQLGAPCKPVVGHQSEAARSGCESGESPRHVGANGEHAVAARARAGEDGQTALTAPVEDRSLLLERGQRLERLEWIVENVEC